MKKSKAIAKSKPATAQELALYDTMCKAIDAAYRVDEVKDIRDKAVALEHYAKQAKNTEAERRACEVRLRAERKAGAILATMQKAKGGKPKGSKKNTASPAPAVSKARSRHVVGTPEISHEQSRQWQQLAKVPEEQFEAALASDDRPSTSSIIRATAEPKINPVSTDALWLQLSARRCCCWRSSSVMAR